MENNILNNENIKWVPLSITFIQYPEGDFIGKILALISLIPILIMCGFGTLILFKRDLHTIMFFIGSILNEGINHTLKHIIKEPRPLERSSNYNEYGMPSSHSQFMSFFSSYMTLFIFIRLHHMNNNGTMEQTARILVFLTCWILTFLVCVSRIYLLYHTFLQVAIGLLIGLCFALFWFCLVNFSLTPLFPAIVSWKISEFFLIRDTTLIPNILWFEYMMTRQESRARSRKLISMKSQ